VKLRAVPRRLWIAMLVLGAQTYFLGWSILEVGPHVVTGTWFVLGVVFLVLLPFGHPLARQWGFYVAGILSILGALWMVSMLFYLTWESLIGALTLLAGLVLWWSLCGQAVRRYFELYCTRCGSYNTRARSLLYARIGCRRCGREWKRGQKVESVFE
jgi:hypothetical protein